MKRHYIVYSILLTFVLFANSCKSNKTKPDTLVNPEFNYATIKPDSGMHAISRTKYYEQLQGFWLGECIANWTGLITEMDKIGNVGEIQTGDFYTRNDWGKADQPSIWGQGVPSDLSSTIDFVFVDKDSIWGADDDTDIEYMYQHLLYTNETNILTPEQIRDGWLHHIFSQKEKTPFRKDSDGNYENYLWVSNQRAYNLMEEKGMLPPETGKPENNEHYDMIDAQLTTEIFGLFAPGRPDVALEMAYLPIHTTAHGNAAWISEFYVTMHALASVKSDTELLNDRIMWMANEARKKLPHHSYAAKMYDFVLSRYNAGVTWEQARDEIYQRYQVEQKDGYNLTSRGLYCNGCFAAGINFASSLVSLFWGEGDIKETIKIAVLAGWDADNPAATWGGLLGFMIGKNGVEEAFGREFSNRFNIHRTRRNFPNQGIDTFENMARKGVFIIDRVVQEQMGGGIDPDKNVWIIR